MLLKQLRKKPFCNDLHYFLLALVLSFLAFDYPLFILLLIIYLVFIIKKTKYIFPIFILIMIVLLSMGIKNFIKINNKKTSYYGVVEEVSEKYYIIRDGLVRIKVYEKNHSYIPSDYVYVEIKIYDDEKSYENDFDSNNYLLANDIYYQGRANKSEYIKKSFSIGYIKYSILSYLENNLSKDSYSYVSSLVLNNNLLNDDIKDSFSVLGLSHILAISGLHIMILYKIIAFILLKLFHYYRNTIPIVIVSIYVIVIGCPLSSLRALLFLIINTFNNHSEVKYTKLDILSISFIFMIIINPYVIYSYGFILSFLVSFTMIVNNELFTGNSLMKSIKSYIIIFLSVLPIIVNMTNKISIISVLISPLFSNIISYLLIPTGYLLSLFPVLDIILKYIFIITNTIVEALSSLAITINAQSFNIYFMLVYYLLFAYLIIGIMKKKYARPILYISLFLTIFLNYKYLNPLTKVVFIDVGQGDSALICNSNNRGNILIDAYSSYNYLKSEGIDKIDYLILTHSDDDHLGDYEKIIDEFNVKLVLYPIFDEGFKDIIFKTNSLGIKENYEFSIGNISAIALGPINPYNDSNSNSLVFKIKIYDTSFLFTGDMTIKEEKDLINKYKNILDSDILKVGHHGSNTSSSLEFLDYVTPNYSIVSVGKYNYYGLPNSDIITRLKNISQVYQTKDSGNITFYLYRNKVIVSTYR